tara:strand:- start:745 stop:1977 length:1233 start_codon:yes stop_codon:yes gene_type:complete
MRTYCRTCGSSNLKNFLNLGFTPPADQFLRESQLLEPETHYPLETAICEDCGLAQLNYVVPAEILYRRDYPYESSITKSGYEHWSEFAESVCNKYRLGAKDLVIDIGSNVGVLLSAFKEQGTRILGIDPASNIVRIAEKRGIETWDEFFSESISHKIIKEKGFASIITGTNVFAHVDDLRSFMRGVDSILNDQGVFIFEAPYFGNLIEFMEYDTIYHEHLSYFSLKPVMKFVEDFNMEVIHVEERDIHGGSFRVHISRLGSHKIDKSVKKFIDKEKNLNLEADKTLLDFANKVYSNRISLHSLLWDLKNKGNKIAGVSAPAKGMTLLNYCRLGPELLEFITEKSTLKQGRFCPGTHIPVVGDEELINQDIDYALLLAWNFSKEIMNNLKEFTDRGGKFIIPIPIPHIIGD